MQRMQRTVEAGDLLNLDLVWHRNRLVHFLTRQQHFPRLWLQRRLRLYCVTVGSVTSIDCHFEHFQYIPLFRQLRRFVRAFCIFLSDFDFPFFVALERMIGADCLLDDHSVCGWPKFRHILVFSFDDFASFGCNVCVQQMRTHRNGLRTQGQ